MSLYTVTFNPLGKKVKVNRGTTLIEAASEADISINNVCGGDGICGHCRMIVTEGKVSGRISEKLTPDEVKKGYVLACMSFVESDVAVLIPEETLIREKDEADEDILRYKKAEDVFSRDTWHHFPLVQKIYLELEQPSLSNNTADHQRVCSAIKNRLHVAFSQAGLKIIKSLPDILRDNNYHITATVGIRGNIAEFMYVEGGNTADKNYLVVVDMGTTTVVAHLIDANKYETIDMKACFNSQGIYGREVTGRLISAEKEGRAKLHKLLVDDINELIGELVRDNKVHYKDITAVICAGNTVMGHFLLDLPIENIRRTPYIATSIEPPPLRAAQVGIKINPRGLLYSLPGISGWVGSDLTAGILSTGLFEKHETSLLVDIGTNGEVIVGNSEWIMACSASAGPALEGASVECGVRAEKGAIERVYIKSGKICYDTIGKAPPMGICGSGIIDLLSVLLNEGIINRSGKIVKKNPKRVITKEGIKRYYLVLENENRNKKPVYITEADIENIITAKAAIYAAMKILLHRLDLQFTDIKHFYLAGAFGNYLDVENAITIGLIPNIPRDKVIFAGNTSIKGATIAALSQDALNKIIEIERNTTYFDLMGASDYIEEFTKAMFLPHTDIEAFQTVTN